MDYRILLAAPLAAAAVSASGADELRKPEGWSAAATYAYAAARTKTTARCADIVRKHFPKPPRVT